MKLYVCSVWGGLTHSAEVVETDEMDTAAMLEAAATVRRLRSDRECELGGQVSNGSPVTVELISDTGFASLLVKIPGVGEQKFTIVPDTCDPTVAKGILFARTAGSAGAERFSAGKGRPTEDETVAERAKAEATASNIASRLPTVFTVASPHAREVELAMSIEARVVCIAAVLMPGRNVW